MITVSSTQSFLDIAIQEQGSVFACVDIAGTNQMNITDELLPGQKLNISVSEYQNNEILSFYKNSNRKVATAGIPVFTDLEYEFPQGEFPISL